MSEPAFDPEVVALLQEVARDSGSSLLRLPKGPLSRWVARPEEVVSPRGSHLSKVERHLVEAYREEAAWVLLRACIAELKHLALVFSRAKTEQEELRKKAGSMNENPHGLSAELDMIAKGQELSAGQLAVASMRLSPTDLGRNVLSICLQRNGQNASSIHLLNRLLASTHSLAQKAQAHENLAQAWVADGDYARALECNVLASRLDETKARFVAWCLTNALQDGNERSARRSALELEDHPCACELEAVAMALKSGRAVGFWKPTAKSRPLAMRLRGEVSSFVEGVLDAFI